MPKFTTHEVIDLFLAKIIRSDEARALLGLDPFIRESALTRDGDGNVTGIDYTKTSEVPEGVDPDAYVKHLMQVEHHLIHPDARPIQTQTVILRNATTGEETVL